MSIDSLSRKQQLTSLLNTAAKLSGAGLSFLMLIFLARSMSPTDFGDFTLALAWLAIASTLTTFSTPLLLVRVIAESMANGKPGLARGGLHFALALAMGLALVAALLVYFLGTVGALPLPRGLGDATLTLALLVPTNTLILVLSGLLQGMKHVLAAEVLVNALRPLLLMACAGALWYDNTGKLTVEEVLAVYLAVSAVLVLACLLYAKLLGPLALWQSLPEMAPRPWFRIATGFMIIALATALNERVDILVMGLLAGPDELASYAVAARFSQTMTMVGIAVCAVAAPHVAEHLGTIRSRRDPVAVQTIIRQNSRTILVLMASAATLLAIAGPLILTLFGPHYQSAYAPMVILAGGITLASLLGPSVSFAAFIGETRTAILALLLGLASNAGLSLLLTPAAGATGAAIAMVAGMTISTVLAHAALKVRCQLDTRAFSKIPLPVQPDEPEPKQQ